MSFSMQSQLVDNKFTLFINNFSSLPSEVISSRPFVIGGCKWRLLAYPKGRYSADYFFLYLQVADYMSLPDGWRRHARYRITVVNQSSAKNSEHETERWFDKNTSLWCSQAILPLAELHAKDSGFLVNNKVKIVVKLEVLEVIGKLDVPQAVETQPFKKKMKLNVDDNVVSTDVNGFQVLPSQVDFVRHMFEKHPDIALEFRPKNPLLKTAYMNVLLSLTEIVGKSPGEISKDDLANAYDSLGSMRDVGFKLDWLEKKLNEVSQKKEKEESYVTRMLEIEEELMNLKAKVLAARAPLDDVF